MPRAPGGVTTRISSDAAGSCCSMGVRGGLVSTARSMRPVSRRSSSEKLKPSTSFSWMPGKSAATCARQSGASSGASVGDKPRLTAPATSPAPSRASSRAKSTSRTMRRARSRKRRPAAVSWMPRGRRLNRVQPSSSSMACTLRLSADCTRPSSPAARVMLPSSAVRMKHLRSRRSMEGAARHPILAWVRCLHFVGQRQPESLASMPTSHPSGAIMEAIDVAIIGTGWCGGIRAETLARHPFAKALHIAENRPERLAEMKALVNPKTATTDWHDIVANERIAAVYISATPETTHYPMAKACLQAGKHVFLEKPIAMTLEEADELIALARTKKLKFTIGYSQRFNTKFAYVRKAIREGSIGTPVSALVSRHISRALGKKITGRTKLSPAAMESTHDLDFVLWCLEPAKPVRVYSQNNYGAIQAMSGTETPDLQWINVTMDNGVSFVVGGGWSLPPNYPNFSTTMIEMIGTEGAVFVDDSHKDVVVRSMKDGMQLPMSSMPGEQVEHVYAGPMAAETEHF